MSKLGVVGIAGALCVLVLFVIGVYGGQNITLTIISEYGTPDPPVGVHTTYNKGDVITASVASPVLDEEEEGVRYACVGWKAKGSKPSNPQGFDPPEIPSVGFTNSVTFTINSNVVLTWKWKPQYLLTVYVNDPSAGYVDIWSEDQETPEDGWWNHKSVVQLEAVANGGYDFDYWEGGSSRALLQDPTENPTAQQMRGPETITAHFVEEP